nr:MAG TPA: hypothetical protein [Caudoviricetes sp.]
MTLFFQSDKIYSGVSVRLCRRYTAYFVHITRSV